jgi:hypothetical protein
VPGECAREVTLDPGVSLRTLRSEDKGQAGAWPDRTRAIPCMGAVRRGEPGELMVLSANLVITAAWH